MIQTFHDNLTVAVFAGEVPRRIGKGDAAAAYKALKALDSAKSLRDLKGAGFSLEALKRDRLGQHSIRANRSWRVCFIWDAGDAYEVEINNHYR